MNVSVKQNLDDYIELIKESEHFYKNLSDKEKTVIQDYGNIYSRFYYYLFSGMIYKIYSDTLIDEGMRGIQELFALFSSPNIPKTKKEMIVYTGQQSHLYSLKNNRMTSHNFLSTSILPQISMNFTKDDNTCCLYKISIPQGTPVLLYFVEDEPWKDSEFEIILPPHITLQEAPADQETVSLSRLTRGIIGSSAEKLSNTSSFVNGLFQKGTKKSTTIYSLRYMGAPSATLFLTYLDAYSRFLKYTIRNYSNNTLSDIYSSISTYIRTQEFDTDKLNSIEEQKDVKTLSMLDFVKSIIDNEAVCSHVGTVSYLTDGI